MLEIEITPNRPDCLSVIGVARELAALTARTFRPPLIAPKESDVSVSTLARARIEAPDLCARFTARVISGVRVGPSPAWMATRLRAVGLRPISNVVDVTNYVLWELGHPLHAFDYDTVAAGTIVVRRAAAGEVLTTLDGQERTLTDTMLVIADPARAIGLAGVMGGAVSEVSGGTTRVLLESAYFAPVSIRRTARALGLRDRRRLSLRARCGHRGPRRRQCAGGTAHRRSDRWNHRPGARRCVSGAATPAARAPAHDAGPAGAGSGAATGSCSRHPPGTGPAHRRARR